MQARSIAMLLPRRVARSRSIFLLALLLAGLLLAGCSVGAYQFDFFQEMHYAQSYRAQEVPRLDSPDSAAPFAQRGVATALQVPTSYDLLSFAEMATVENPVLGTGATLTQARELYRINCAGCHGEQGDGQSIAAAFFQGYQVERPVRFTPKGIDDGDNALEQDARTLSRTDGELFWIITHGTADLGETPTDPPRGHMPAFRRFLSADDRWALVLAVGEFREGTGP